MDNIDNRTYRLSKQNALFIGRRLLGITILIAIIFTLAACGGGNDNAENSTNTGIVDSAAAEKVAKRYVENLLSGNAEKCVELTSEITINSSAPSVKLYTKSVQDSIDSFSKNTVSKYGKDWKYEVNIIDSLPYEPAAGDSPIDGMDAVIVVLTVKFSGKVLFSEITDSQDSSWLIVKEDNAWKVYKGLDENSLEEMALEQHISTGFEEVERKIASDDFEGASQILDDIEAYAYDDNTLKKASELRDKNSIAGFKYYMDKKDYNSAIQFIDESYFSPNHYRTISGDMETSVIEEAEKIYRSGDYTTASDLLNYALGYNYGSRALMNAFISIYTDYSETLAADGKYYEALNSFPEILSNDASIVKTISKNTYQWAQELMRQEKYYDALSIVEAGINIAGDSSLEALRYNLEERISNPDYSGANSANDASLENGSSGAASSGFAIQNYLGSWANSDIGGGNGGYLLECTQDGSGAFSVEITRYYSREVGQLVSASHEIEPFELLGNTLSFRYEDTYGSSGNATITFDNHRIYVSLSEGDSTFQYKLVDGSIDGYELVYMPNVYSVLN